MFTGGKAVRKTANFQINTTDDTDVFEVLNGLTITLPPISLSYGRTIVIKKMDVAGTITIDGYSSETIDDSAFIQIQNQYSYVVVYASAQTPGNWGIVASNELSGTATGWDGTVTDYASLPAAASHVNEVYLVEQSSGVYLINRKPAGLYQSDGAVWTYLGRDAQTFYDANFKLVNSIDQNKVGNFDLSAITTGQQREVKFADANVDLADIGTNSDNIQLLENIHTDTNEPTGFVNRTDSTVTFTDGTLTFQIAPAVTSFDFYISGTKYTKSAAESVIITDTEGLWYFYYDNTGTLQASQTFSIDYILKNSLAGIIYWDATNKRNIFNGVGDERHLITMDGATHLNIHRFRGTSYVSGLALGDITADGSGDVNASAQLSIANGEIADEDINIIIPTDAIPANAPVFYRTGAAGNWRSDAATDYPCKRFGTSRLAYNQFTGGAWQQTEITNNDFVLSHLVATNIPDNPIIVIQGQADYATLVTARDGANDEINNLILSGLPFVEFVFIGTVIFQTSDSYTNAVQARIRSTDTGEDYVDWRASTLSPTTGPTSHPDLTGRDTPDQHPTSSISTDTTNFDGILSSADDTTQKALETIDDFYINNYLEGFNLSNNATNPSYQVDISSGFCRNDDNDNNIESLSTITVDITASGVNGLDTGTEAASRWYYVWIIYNPTTDTAAGLLSLSSSAPTLPTGYTKKRRIGVIRNDSGSDFLEFESIGPYNEKRYYYKEALSVRAILLLGGALTWTTVDGSALIPPTTERALIFLFQSKDKKNQFAYIRPSSSFPDETAIGNGVLDTFTDEFYMPSQSLQYYATDVDIELNLYVNGYVEVI